MVEKIDVPKPRSDSRNMSDTPTILPHRVSSRSPEPRHGFRVARSGHNTGVVDEQAPAGGGGDPVLLQFQRALLPSRLPEIEGLPLTARYLPGGSPDKLGGDWYDVVPLEGGAVALMVGDVAGGDLVATVLMAQLRSAVRAYALEGHPPTAVVSRANDFHLALASERLATLAYAQVHPVERLVTVVRAGHVPPVLAAPGQEPCFLDGVGGPPLGVRRGELWRESTTQLPPGSTLVLYTDGLIRDRGSMEDGIGQVLTAITRGGPAIAPDEIADRLVQLVPERPPDDTVLLIGQLSADRTDPVSELRRTLPPTPESATVARWLVSDLLRETVEAEAMDVAALLTTELVSNAIRHTRDELVLTVRLAGGRLRVGVSDSSHRRPQLVRAGKRDTSGRGLHLVEALADGWGVDPDERGLGKTVWFELAAGVA
jgi:anti-sigma regulatory factor (Ser/Thr protein kinase)